ncbi:MAG: hypothetical protein H0U10_17420 [Chloroflexia bacterium]|nr:hypothetical protein [Chloroflexia bacterium]
MVEGEPNPGSAHDLIRVGLTLASLAVAVAAFVRTGPIVPFFLVAGLMAAIATGYAIAQAWADAGLGPRHLVPLRRPEGRDLRYEALVYITWSMIALIVAVGVFLFTALER